MDPLFQARPLLLLSGASQLLLRLALLALVRTYSLPWRSFVLFPLHWHLPGHQHALSSLGRDFLPLDGGGF